MTTRGGIRGVPSKVSYLGASVTEQRNGYRPRLHELLERRFGCSLESVVAGLGGMDAMSIVFLTDEFVTSHGPDLCFVDVTSSLLIGSRTLEEGQGALDGIFAKLSQSGCTPCLVHLPRQEYPDHFADLLDCYEAVAARHGVPSVDVASPFRQAVTSGLLDDGELFRDQVHTTPAGSAEYARVIDTAVNELLASEGRGPPPLPAEPTISFRDARLVPADPGDGGEPGRFRMIQPYVCVAEGSCVRRTFAGRLEGIALVLGPESGGIEVTDAAGSQRSITWDQWSHFDRYGARLFRRRLEPGEVTIEATDERPDYSRSRAPMDRPDRTTLKLIGYLERP